jgi:short-chain fatty acids transporter
MRDAVSGLGLFVSRTLGRFMPDPFLLAIGLTLAAAVLAVAFGEWRGEGAAAPQLLAAWWTQGIWGLLAFSMQMCLILVTGSAIAASPAVRGLVGLVARRPASMPQAALIVAGASIAAGLLNWGFGLVAGALLARETARSMRARGVACHYPLLVACGYLAMLLWHGGLSGSAPLSMTTPEGAAKVIPPEVLADLAAEGGEAAIPLSQTLLSPLNVFTTGGLAILVPLLMSLLAPRDPRRMEGPEEAIARAGGADRPREASGGERSLLSVAFAVLLGGALVAGFAQWSLRDGLGRLGLDQVNAIMLGLGLLLHGSALSYARAVEDAARGCAGIMLQFPLYAGILGILRESGLLAEFARFAAAVSGEGTLPLATMLSAAVVNLFVPSGGGQWAVQGPIALAAGLERGVPAGTMTMAVAYGDELTNMLQPFWALPLLAITGARARDIVGYTAIAMLLAAAWAALGLWILG